MMLKTRKILRFFRQEVLEELRWVKGLIFLKNKSNIKKIFLILIIMFATHCNSRKNNEIEKDNNINDMKEYNITNYEVSIDELNRMDNKKIVYIVNYLIKNNKNYLLKQIITKSSFSTPGDIVIRFLSNGEIITLEMQNELPKSYYKIEKNSVFLWCDECKGGIPYNKKERWTIENADLSSNEKQVIFYFNSYNLDTNRKEGKIPAVFLGKYSTSELESYIKDKGLSD